MDARKEGKAWRRRRRRCYEKGSEGMKKGNRKEKT